MKRNMYKNMDPLEIQNRFSSEKGIFTGLDESSFKFEDVKPFIDKLPQRERDLIEMYYRTNKKQKEIAEFFGVTQGAISHRLSRARKRLAFLRDMPKLGDDLKNLLAIHFEDFEIDVIYFMVQTTCQSKTADLLNEKYELSGRGKMTQVKVRHKFDRSIDKLKRLKRRNLGLRTCYDLATYVKKNLYMMHEVILPHFDKGYRVTYSRIS